jgi:MFS transporter, BCD family, chlorophyll transporter
VSAVVFGLALRDFSPARLVQVIQGAAVATLILNAVSLWKQEPRHRQQPAARAAAPSDFFAAWRQLLDGPNARRRLTCIGLGTMAFGMQDVLLEPYGGQVLGMTVGQTTLLTATLATGGLIGFAVASVVLGRGRDAMRMAAQGAALGIPAFLLVVLAGPLASAALFVVGVFLIGLAGGLFSHGTLTATMNSAPRDQIGLALGAWGAVQATAAGVAVALGGLLADAFAALTSRGSGYTSVYLLEVLLLSVTLIGMSPLIKRFALR